MGNNSQVEEFLSSDAGWLCGRVIDEQLGRSLEALGRLLRQPSVSATGEGIDECARLTEALLREYGFEAKTVATGGHPVVLGELGQGERALLLYCHYDVQPVGPLDAWTTPPFEPVTDGDRLYARGAVDDKGHIVSRLAAIEAYVRVHGTPPYRIVFLVEGEEEIGSPSLAQVLTANADTLAADGCVWESGEVDLEGRNVLVLGVRGIVSVELSVRTMRADAHSGERSFLPNAAWRLVWALASLKDPQERILIPGFYDNVKEPTPQQVQLLAGALPSQEALKEEYGAERLAGDLSGHALERFAFSPTCTINGISAGYEGVGSMAVVPASARAKLDFRIVPEQGADDVVRQLRAHLDRRGFADIDVEVSPGNSEPAVADPDDPFVRLVVNASRDVYGQRQVVHPLAGGSGPFERFLALLEIPAAVEGVGFAHAGCLAHAPNEHLLIPYWQRATKHMARILERFGEIER